MSLDRLMEMGTKTSQKVIFEQSNQKRKVLPSPHKKRVINVWKNAGNSSQYWAQWRAGCLGFEWA